MSILCYFSVPKPKNICGSQARTNYSKVNVYGIYRLSLAEGRESFWANKPARIILCVA